MDIENKGRGRGRGRGSRRSGEDKRPPRPRTISGEERNVENQDDLLVIKIDNSPGKTNDVEVEYSDGESTPHESGVKPRSSTTQAADELWWDEEADDVSLSLVGDSHEGIAPEDDIFEPKDLFDGSLEEDHDGLEFHNDGYEEAHVIGPTSQGDTDEWEDCEEEDVTSKASQDSASRNLNPEAPEFTPSSPGAVISPDVLKAQMSGKPRSTQKSSTGKGPQTDKSPRPKTKEEKVTSPPSSSGKVSQKKETDNKIEKKDKDPASKKELFTEKAESSHKDVKKDTDVHKGAHKGPPTTENNKTVIKEAAEQTKIDTKTVNAPVSGDKKDSKTLECSASIPTEKSKSDGNSDSNSSDAQDGGAVSVEPHHSDQDNDVTSTQTEKVSEDFNESEDKEEEVAPSEEKDKCKEDKNSQLPSDVKSQQELADNDGSTNLADSASQEDKSLPTGEEEACDSHARDGDSKAQEEDKTAGSVDGEGRGSMLVYSCSLNRNYQCMY